MIYCVLDAAVIASESLIREVSQRAPLAIARGGFCVALELPDTAERGASLERPPLTAE